MFSTPIRAIAFDLDGTLVDSLTDIAAAANAARAELGLAPLADSRVRGFIGDGSAMLMARVAVRARSMELLAAANGFDTATCEKAFMVGMFSLLGVLFGLPLEKVLAPLNLNDTLSAAVLKNSGEIGHLKQIVETAERLDHKALYPLIEQVTGLSVDGFNRITLEAHSWMHGIINGKQESADA